MNRKILASILVIGAISAVATGSTFALFNDTETSSGNSFEAGVLDLKVDWNESYNGEFVEEQNLTDNPGPIFDISDIKPGDHGEATVSLHLYDNPGFVWSDLQQTANFENGCTEPESEVDDTCGNSGAGEGELGENLYFTVWNDDGDNIQQADEQVIYNGTAEELTDQTNGTNLQEQVAAVPETVSNAVNQEEEQTEVCRSVGGVDTALTLDRSGSMYGKPISAAQNSSKQLVDELNESDQVAVVSFSSSATLDQELTTNKTAVKNAIDQLQASGGTHMYAGVETAHEELMNGSNARENASKVMVVLSDGVSASDPLPAVDAAKDNNVRVITVALGEFADNETLREMASSDDDFYQTSDVSGLSEVFQNVSRDVRCTPSNETEQPVAPTPVVEDDRGLLIDADPEQEGVQPFTNSTTEYVGIKWHVPLEVGNEIQTDSKVFNFTFYAEQARHNTPETEPPEETPAEPPEDNVTFASVNFEDQESEGSSVNVDEVNTSDGGFVAILDDQGSVIGTSSFIQSGVVNNVEVNLTPDLNQSQNLTAQVHQDTDNDQTLDFLTSNGTEDVPYEENGTAVTDDAFINVTDMTAPTSPASVNFEDQTTNGSSVIVQEVNMSDGGFVAIHNESLLQGNAVGSVIGVSQYQTAGPKQDVQVDLFDVSGTTFNQTELQENQTLIAMPHRDTNNNTVYDFVSSNGADDGPYVFNGSAVTDDAEITLVQDEPANNTEFIDAVELCELGTKDSLVVSNCPAQERRLVKFNWTGTDYQSSNQSVNADLDVLQSNQGGPIEVEFTTDQNVSTSVVTTSDGIKCSFPGSDTTPEVCS